MVKSIILVLPQYKNLATKYKEDPLKKALGDLRMVAGAGLDDWKHLAKIIH